MRTTIIQFIYDIHVTDTNGEVREISNQYFESHITKGDFIEWLSCEMEVVKVTHFIGGQSSLVSAVAVTKEEYEKGAGVFSI